MIGAAIAILGPILVKAGAPILKSVLEKEVGGAAGQVGGAVIDAIAGPLGVPPTPEAIAEAHKADPARVEDVIRNVEASQEWIQHLAAATAGRDALLQREDQRENFFAWGWRPAMSWLVIFLFAWAMVLVPTVNAAFKASLVAPSTDDILQFAGIWLVIYGGGHTAKALWGRK